MKISEQYMIGVGLQRLFFFSLVFFFMVHIFSCLWLITASSYDSEYVGTWLEKHATEVKNKNELNPEEQWHFYILAIYWTVTTITTVGYGDISGNNDVERIFCSIAMIAGVIAFTFASGSLSSIISSYDHHNSELGAKLEYLTKIKKELRLPLDLFESIKASMSYEVQDDFEELHDFLKLLPHKLRTQVSLYVYIRKYKHIKFFQNQSQSFVLWIIPRLRPQMFMEKEYIYMENDLIEEIYFIVQGQVAFVLPRYKAAKYVTINEGNFFGFLDIVGYCEMMQIN